MNIYPDSAPDQTATPCPDIDRSLWEDARPPPEPFPRDVLPERWRAWVEVSAQAFTPVDYLAQGLLAAVVAVCGGGIVVRVTPSWAEPLLLWQALVGGPSSGKSPALDAARGLLDDLTVDAGGAGRHATPAVMLEASRRSVAAALSPRPPRLTLWFRRRAEALGRAPPARRAAG